MQGYRPLVLGLSAWLGIMLLLFFVNQTAQVVNLAATLHPRWGTVTLYALLALYFTLLLVPLFWLARLPRPLALPESEAEPAYGEYLRALGRRLQSHPRFRASPPNPEDPASVLRALADLEEEANSCIKSMARRVFVATAISQYGRLDGLIVLLTQFQMIGRVVRVYHQRPSLHQLYSLYLNVGTTTFMATEIGDINIVDEHVEAVFGPLLGSSLLPTSVVALVGNSLIVGAANAFLTLRVGVIARQYCASTVRVRPRELRRAAVAQAAVLLGTVVGEATGTIVAAVVKAAGRTGARTVRATYDLAAQGVKGAMRVKLPGMGLGAWRARRSRTATRGKGPETTNPQE